MPGAAAARPCRAAAPVPPTLKRAWRDELRAAAGRELRPERARRLHGARRSGAAVGREVRRGGRPAAARQGGAHPRCRRATNAPSGEVGEVCLRGGFMKGYWGKPEKTAEAMRGGWLHTGDAGVMDRDGYITMRGRFAELIKVGGRTWFPRDVEEALCAAARASRRRRSSALPGRGARPAAGRLRHADVRRGGSWAASRAADRAALAVRPAPLEVRSVASLPDDADRQDRQGRPA